MSGIRTLDDLRDRCVVDDLTGCWQWGGAKTVSSGGVTAVTQMPVLGRVVTVPRAVLFLRRGVEVPTAHVTWSTCMTRGCCNHVTSGTRAQLGAAIAASGRRKGLAILRLASMKPRPQFLKPEVRAAIKGAPSTETGRALAKRLRVSESSVSRHRRGTVHDVGPFAAWRLAA